ncbi:MAG: hypothetical protein Q7T33_00990 [Dehalococcoidia bacterium]|nr:hypothetical protein [Dehalococcoidia bacterium]
MMIRSYDLGYGSDEAFLAAYGLEPALPETAPEYDGPCTCLPIEEQEAAEREARESAPLQRFARRLVLQFVPITRRDGFLTFQQLRGGAIDPDAASVECAAYSADPAGPVTSSDYVGLWIQEALIAVAAGPENEALLMGETTGDFPPLPDWERWLQEGDCERTRRFGDWRYLAPRGEWGTMKTFESIVRSSLREHRWMVHQAVIVWCRRECGAAAA